jgi:hypothetical protein
LNGGSCTSVTNDFECSCPSDYIGSLCQYSKEDFNFNDFVGNNNFLKLDKFISNPNADMLKDLNSIILNNIDIVDLNKSKQLLTEISKLLLIR